MIKVIFMAKETYSSIKALEYICYVSDITVIGAVIRYNDLGLHKLCEKNHIPILTEAEIKNNYYDGTLSADYIFSFYWKKVSSDLLLIPQIGSINFHPGPLPEARGSGYHIAILENWGYWGVTAHYMDEEFDTGAIIQCNRFSIDANIVNKDLVTLTHERLFALFKDIVNRILDGERFIGEEQTEGRYFSLHELEDSKLINPNESAEQINRKIRAFWNPPYHGAQIDMAGEKYTLINKEILDWIAEKIKT